MSSLVVDMHFGALLGAGWTNSETAGAAGTYLSAAASADIPAGAGEFPVSSVVGFYPGMLMTYQGEDGQFYPFRLNAITGNVLRPDRRLPAAIKLGAPVHNVYLNDAHPNVKGGAMIVDCALRQLAGGVREVEKILREAWTASGGASVSATPVSSYTYPGSDMAGFRGMTVTGTALNAGVDGTFTSLQGGDYIAKVTLNTGSRSTIYNNSVVVYVDEKDADGTVRTLSTSETFIGYDATFAVELPFVAQYGKTYRTRVICPATGPWSFAVGQVEFFRIIGGPVDLTTGKHVLFGDSWVTPGSPIATGMTERLNNATVVAKGIGGNKASQLISRFATDVTPEAPNFVWVMVGTNDYYQGVAPGDFETQIAQLRTMITGIGAIPIFFTPSVGAITYNPSQFFPSRRYVTYVRYWDLVTPVPDTSVAPWKSAQVSKQALSVCPGEAATAYAVAGKTKQSAVLNLLAADNPNLTVRAGFSASPSGAALSDVTEFNTSTEKRKLWIKRASTDARFLCVQVFNPTANTENVSFVADLAWVPE